VNVLVFGNSGSGKSTLAKARPWEPHKYPSKEDQDNNLAMLLDWIAQYSVRPDTFSHAAHSQLYERYVGKKTMYVSNDQSNNTL